jgi:non-specific serine/threonine protein kinase
MALVQGRLGEAGKQLGESLRLWWEGGQLASVAASLENHAQLAAASGQRDDALRVVGAAMGLRTTLRVAAPPSLIRALPILREAWLDEARTTLGQERVEKLLSDGRAMSTGDAVRYALRAGQSSLADTSLTASSPLTRREQEVARLVARGRSNRQIA